MKKLWLALMSGVLALPIIFSVAIAKADVNDFVIHRFHGRYELNDQVAGGGMTVKEEISLTFSDYNHGILRALPKKYDGNNTKIEVLNIMRDGKTEPYSTYSDSNGNLVLKIGDANVTITGPHDYEITYKQRGIIHFLEDHDEFYWDINGIDWDQPFESVSAEVIMPPGWQEPSLGTSCYTGSLDSNETSCIIGKADRTVNVVTTRLLNHSENLTVAIPIQKGLFRPITWQDKVRDNLVQLTGLVLPPLVIGGLALRLWLKKGKEYAGRGVIVPEYTPPKNLTPAEVGLIADFRTDGRDLSATLIDLAIRNYIRIHDDQKKRLFGGFKHNFSFELTKNDYSTLKPHEQSLLTAIFSPSISVTDMKQLVQTVFKGSYHIKEAKKLVLVDGAASQPQVGTIVELKKVDRYRLQSAAETIRKELANSLSGDHAYFENNPQKASGGLMIAFFVLIFLGVFLHPGWGWTVGIIISAGICFLLGLFMPKRSHLGTETLEYIEGLKLYMNTAEKDRLKMLQSVDRPFEPPSKTVKLYESLLPFAIALGVEKSWSNQFADIYTAQPDWYRGNAAYFNVHSFSNDLSSGVGTLSSSFAAQSSSSSSGSGGGGSSGGGGGGGGGGGW